MDIRYQYKECHIFKIPWNKQIIMKDWVTISLPENIKNYHIYHSFISDENGADSNSCDDPELQVEKPNVSINDEVPSDEKENLQPEPDISTIAIKQISGDENVISTAVEDWKQIVYHLSKNDKIHIIKKNMNELSFYIHV